MRTGGFSGRIARDIVGIKPSQVFATNDGDQEPLLGEDDIVDAMSMYAYAMHKKMAFDRSVIAETQTAQDKLGDNEYSHLGCR